ncbi:MAG: GntR family transcriptional regulator [Oscillospiraceae bacterium]|nr:GntR family transcriptional regulator [Oscillospiraceae bacterium]
MQPTFDSQKPLFLSIAEWLEDAILAGAYKEESQVPSITEISLSYKINPATALKGVNMLVDSGLLYKKRGLGMFVATGACKKLLRRRQEQFYEDFIRPLAAEAKRLEIGADELSAMVKRGYEQ